MLCDEYGVSRITLRHAVDGLVADGRLAREHGRGTFVIEPRYRMQYRERLSGAIIGFHNQQRDEGFVVTSRVLEQRIAPARHGVAEPLGISTADPVVELVRLRYVNGTLHHLAKTYLARDRFPDTATADLTDESLYAYLGERYGVTLMRNELLVSLEPADFSFAEHVAVDVGDTLLSVASTVYDQANRPVAYGTSFMAPNSSELSFTLHG
ncbi:GntR family transcriptional regulator [Okibacterium endophyticum]